MKHIVNEFDVFTFNELSDDAKEYAIQKERESETRVNKEELEENEDILYYKDGDIYSYI